MKITLPKKAAYIIDTLQKRGFEAFAVGGCIRDSLLKREPGDWDITTNALPEHIIESFQKTIPTGLKHGTITVMLEGEPFEVTTYRIDGEYKDNRRPDIVKFVSSIKEDLSRRDFSINALAYNDDQGLLDYFDGLEDLSKGLIRCVGSPHRRFNEDALRMLRAIRFSAQLGFTIEEETFLSIKRNSSLIKNISQERIREELNKILLSSEPSKAFIALEETGILKEILPEIANMVGFNQRNPHHDKDVFMHTLKVVDNSPVDLNVRLAALFHDVGKPLTFTIDKKGVGHFYGHDSLGAEVAEKAMKRLTYDNKTIALVKSLVKHHMIMFNSPKDTTLKRLITQIGKENMPLLYELERADLKGSRSSYDLSLVNNLEERVNIIIENKEPLTIRDLHITGEDIMRELSLKPGKAIGTILNYLLERVLENPSLNKYDYLLDMAKECLLKL